MKETVVGTIIFRKKDNDWEFLLLKRLPEQGNFWQPPSGSVDEGDKTHLDTAYREVFEESGIKKEQVLSVIKDLNYYRFDKKSSTGETVDFEAYIFAFEVEPDVIVNIKNNVDLEHDDYKWVSFEEALTLLDWERQKKSFRKLHSLLSNI
ncbi:MAG: NUDIX domain-containing protein [archaeon]